MNACDDVIRELAAPTDDRDPSAIEAHLAACPSCALWAGRNAGLDRLWAATAPEEPAPAAWDAVWAGISAGLDAAAAPDAATAPAPLRLVGAPTAPARSRRFGRRALGLAQAAALLIGAGLLLRQGQAPRPGPALAPAPSPAVAAYTATTPEYVIEAGQVVLIPVAARDVAPRELDLEPASGTPDACDDQFVMLSAVESLAQGGANW